MSIKLNLAPSPTGHTTLQEKKLMTERAIKIQEIVSHGNAYIPPGTIERTRGMRDDLGARMELTLQVHPELEEMYVQHGNLLNAHAKAKSSEEGAEAIAEQCRELGQKIKAIEQSVDLG